MWLVCFRSVVDAKNRPCKFVKRCPPNSTRACVHYAKKGPVLRGSACLTSRAILGESYSNFSIGCTRLAEDGEIAAPCIIEHDRYRHPIVVHVDGMNNESSELLLRVHTARREFGDGHVLAFTGRECFIDGHSEIAAVGR